MLAITVNQNPLTTPAQSYGTVGLPTLLAMMVLAVLLCHSITAGSKHAGTSCALQTQALTEWTDHKCNPEAA